MTVSKGGGGLNARAPSLKDCGRLAFFKKDIYSYEGWNFNSGNYLFTTDTK